MQTNTDSEIFDRYTTNQDAGKSENTEQTETKENETKQEKMMNMDEKQAWAESQNYRNFLRNVEKFGTSKRTWIHRGRPKKKLTVRKSNCERNHDQEMKKMTQQPNVTRLQKHSEQQWQHHWKPMDQE